MPGAPSLSLSPQPFILPPAVEQFGRVLPADPENASHVGVLDESSFAEQRQKRCEFFGNSRRNRRLEDSVDAAALLLADRESAADQVLLAAGERTTVAVAPG